VRLVRLVRGLLQDYSTVPFALQTCPISNAKAEILNKSGLSFSPS